MYDVGNLYDDTRRSFFCVVVEKMCYYVNHMHFFTHNTSRGIPQQYAAAVSNI